MAQPARVLSHPERGRGGAYLTFQFAGQYFAVKECVVRAVQTGSSMTWEPSEDGTVLGRTLVNGRSVPVVDVSARLGCSQRVSSVGWLLVLEVRGRPVAVPVDGVSEVLDVHERDFRNNTIQVRENGRAYGRPKLVIDPNRLLTPAEIDRLS